MLGEVSPRGAKFSYRTPEFRIPADHPIRKVSKVVDQALKELAPTFDDMYSSVDRPSIPPEQLIRSMLLQVLFTIRSERRLVKRLDYDLMFRWFVGLGMDDMIWNHSTFSKNRNRLMVH
jgi:transposase